MVRETYESPKMTFEDVRVNEAVAGVCWGNHANGATMFTDINGAGGGYMSFQIDAGSCDLSLSNVMYYEAKGIDGVNVDESDKRYTDLEEYLKKSGGQCGNNYNKNKIYVTSNPNDPALS